MSEYQIKEIIGFKGYFVDTNGIIFSAWQQHGRNNLQIDESNLHEIKLHKLPHTGHLTTILRKNGTPKTVRPQRAVAFAFLENSDPLNKTYVCHKDGNPSNNNVDNLYWGTPLENTNDMKRHGTMAVGEKLPQSKLNDKIVRVIKHLLEDRWYGITQYDIGKFFGVRQDDISRIKNGHYWKHIII